MQLVDQSWVVEIREDGEHFSSSLYCGETEAGGPMTTPDLAERMQIVERLTVVFRVERIAYLSVTFTAFVMLAVSGTILIIDKGPQPSELTLLFGSTGLLGFSGSQILRMWNRSLDWIGGKSLDQN